jgi:hypothetical protein
MSSLLSLPWATVSNCASYVAYEGYSSLAACSRTTALLWDEHAQYWTASLARGYVHTDLLMAADKYSPRELCKLTYLHAKAKNDNQSLIASAGTPSSQDQDLEVLSNTLQPSRCFTELQLQRTRNAGTGTELVTAQFAINAQIAAVNTQIRSACA